MALLEDACAVRRRILCSTNPGRSCPVRLHGFLESRGVAVCDSGLVLRLGAVFSGRCAGRVAGATPLERSCWSLAERFTDRARGGDSTCCTVQPCWRIARPTYGAYRRSRSVSAPGRNPAVDPAMLAASPKSASTKGVIPSCAKTRPFSNRPEISSLDALGIRTESRVLRAAGLASDPWAAGGGRQAYRGCARLAQVG